MELAFQILIPVAVFVVLGALMSTMLAIASRAFAVKTDERVEAIAEFFRAQTAAAADMPDVMLLPRRSCAEMQRRRRAAAGEETAKKIAAIMGNRGRVVGQNESAGHVSGTDGCAKKKERYLRG